MNRTAPLAVLVLALLLFSGCAPSQGPASADASQEHVFEADSTREAIPFSGDQCYAVAYLGYQETGALDLYVQRYLDGGSLPIHYFSPGDYYLIIPRYPGMSLALYRNDIASDQPALVYTDPDCRPFVIQCNASDIFEDATIRLSRGEDLVEFSPFLSLKDGTIVVGPRGLNLTLETPG